MSEEEVREFIKNNLVIETEYESRYSAGNNVVVSLRIVGESAPFTSATIHIPDED